MYVSTGNIDSNNLEYVLHCESFRYSDYWNFSQVKTEQNNYIENYSPDYKVIQGLQRATKILLTVHIFEQIRKHVILKQAFQEVQQFPSQMTATCSQVCNTKKGSQLKTLQEIVICSKNLNNWGFFLIL